MLWHVGKVRAQLWSCFSPSTMWVLKIQWLGLATGTFTKELSHHPYLVILKRLCLADSMYGPPYPDMCGEGPGAC